MKDQKANNLLENISLKKTTPKKLIFPEVLSEMKALEASTWLLGKVIQTGSGSRLTSAVITETEAYCGVADRACHAYGGRRTERTEVMFRDGGHVYVYLCYGMYELLNFVVAKEGEPEAVLIRAVYPLEGWSAILRRRNSEKWKKGLMSGPGKVTQGLSITREMNGTRIGDKILLYDIGISIPRGIIKNGPRIGVDYAGPDALLPYRFWCEEEDIIRLLSSTRALSDNRPQGNKD